MNHRGRASEQASSCRATSFAPPLIPLPHPDARQESPPAGRPFPRSSTRTRSTGASRPNIGPNSLGRRDYPVNNALNLPPRSIPLLLLRNFPVANRSQPCSPPSSASASYHLSSCFSSSVRSPRFILTREQLLRVRPRNGRAFYLAFVSPGRRHALPRVRGVTPSYSMKRRR